MKDFLYIEVLWSLLNALEKDPNVLEITNRIVGSDFEPTENYRVRIVHWARNKMQGNLRNLLANPNICKHIETLKQPNVFDVWLRAKYWPIEECYALAAEMNVEINESHSNSEKWKTVCLAGQHRNLLVFFNKKTGV